MKQPEIDLLSEIYNHYLETHNRECSFLFQDVSYQEKHDTCNSLDYLQECGFIRYTTRTLGFWQFKITVDGIKFVENNFQEQQAAPLVQGPNSIYISGSGNTISDNYNQISANISQSDLPDEVKQLIETLIYELKNPHITPEIRSSKIKTFLSDITSGTLSGDAASGLTMLLTSMFSQISL